MPRMTPADVMWRRMVLSLVLLGAVMVVGIVGYLLAGTVIGASGMFMWSRHRQVKLAGHQQLFEPGHPENERADQLANQGIAELAV